VAGGGSLSAPRGDGGAPAPASAGLDAGSGARAPAPISGSGAGSGGGIARPALDTTALDGTGDSRGELGRGVGRVALAARADVV